MNRIYLLFIVFFSFAYLYGEDFSITVNRKNDFIRHMNVYHQEDDILVQSGTKYIHNKKERFFCLYDLEVGVNKRKVERESGEWIKGVYNNAIITRKDSQFYSIDIKSLERKPFYHPVLEYDYLKAYSIVEYQNNQFFFAFPFSRTPDGRFFFTVKVDPDNNSVTYYNKRFEDYFDVDFPIQYSDVHKDIGFGDASIMEFSRDKLTFIGKGQIGFGYVYDFAKRKIIGQSRIDGNDNIRYLTNHLVYIMKEERSTENKIFFSITDLELNELHQITFSIDDFSVDSFWNFWISEDYTQALIDYEKGDKSGSFLLDTTPFRDWLLDQGLLFRETTGTIIGTPDLREYPNLEAKIFGTLEPGMEVTVYDQSGIQVEIGEHTDWWYEIETASGEKGWVYGPYIEVEGQEVFVPEATPTVEVEDLLF